MGDRIPTAIERASAVEPFSIRDDYAILTVRIDGGVSTTRGPCAAAALTPAPVSHRAAEPPGHGRFYPSETTIAIQFTGADERTEQRSVRPGNECRFLVRPPHHFGVGETSAAPIRAAAKLRNTTLISSSGRTREPAHSSPVRRRAAIVVRSYRTPSDRICRSTRRLDGSVHRAPAEIRYDRDAVR